MIGLSAANFSSKFVTFNIRHISHEISPYATVVFARFLGSDIGKLATTEAEVETAQLRVKSAPTARPIPNKPTGLELAAGDEEGELSGQCAGQPGMVDYYEIRFTTTDPNAAGTVWQFADTSKKSRFDLSGLPTGVKVWVELRA